MDKENEMKEAGQEQGTPAPEGKTEVIPDDRPEKNWKAELDRKLADRDAVIEKLKSELDGVKQGQTQKEIDDLDKKLEGYDQDFVKTLEKKFDSKVEKMKKDFEDKSLKEIAAIKTQVYASSKDRNLEDIKNDDKTGIVKQNYTEIKKVIDELNPEIWSNRESMENAVSMVLGKIIMKKPASAKPVPSPTNDDPTPPPAKTTVGHAKKGTIESYKEMGLDDDKAKEVASASDELDKVMFGKK